jgi:hypothetical protein
VEGGSSVLAATAITDGSDGFIHGLFTSGGDCSN